MTTLLTPAEFLHGAPVIERHGRLVTFLRIGERAQRSAKQIRSDKNRNYKKNLRADPVRRKRRAEYMREWHKAHPGSRNKYRLAWRAKNPERYRSYQRVWMRVRRAAT